MTVASFSTGVEVSLVSSFATLAEGDSGTTPVQMCLRLTSSLQLRRDVNLILNTMGVTAGIR